MAISIELVGVITIGAASELASNAFPDATVWTGFGSGYGFGPSCCRSSACGVAPHVLTWSVPGRPG